MESVLQCMFLLLKKETCIVLLNEFNNSNANLCPLMLILALIKYKLRILLLIKGR